MGTSRPSSAPPGIDLEALRSIERRALWLAVRMVDHANHDRPNDSGVKVGGHQASSASLVTVMTVLWFAFLDAEDRVSVKPHASPVLHAINYLLGDLPEESLRTLRAFAGLQAYPSRTKDPSRVDFSTGSVGLGAAAPLFAAAVRRYVDLHFGPRPPARFVSILGDAELDEGNVWEAIADPATAGLGNVLWVVDFNRQSLDRVVPGVRIHQWRSQFEAAGWHVCAAKHGTRLEGALADDGGGEFRRWFDTIPNDQYQAIFGSAPGEARKVFLDGAPAAARAFCDRYDDESLYGLVTDLGGHDPEVLLRCLGECDREVDRPSVLFAYTLKGFGLPGVGNARNHSALLNRDQVDQLRSATSLPVESEWARFDPASPEGQVVGRTTQRLARASTPSAPIPGPPPELLDSWAPATSSTQEAFGRALVALARQADTSPYLVTTSPDVATSTNLGGLINKVGVFAPDERDSYQSSLLLRWEEHPRGQHIELGISEMNLFLLLGQLGLSHDLSGQRLLPVGTVYDPFVLRGLDALIYSVYSGARFVFAGTPSGISLAPEGGAHQSTITPSVGLELPGLAFHEPAYAVSLDWLLSDALRQVASGASDHGELAHYFRLSTRPIDQAPFRARLGEVGEAALRRLVLAGAYRLVDGHGASEAGPAVQIAASGAVMPEALEAAAALETEGVRATVVDVVSHGRLYRGWVDSLRTAIDGATVPGLAPGLHGAFDLGVPTVTVHDGSSHALAWLGSALRCPLVPVGVDDFGQSGAVSDLYRTHNLTPDAIVNAALVAVALGR